MSLGIVVSDAIVSTVEVGVAVYNEILGDPANDPAIENNRKGMKRTRRKVPQSVVRRIATTLPLKPENRLKIPISRFQEEYGLSVSNNGKYSVSPFEDISWLYEEEGNIQSSYRTHRFTPNPYPKDFIQRWEIRPQRAGSRSRNASNNDDFCDGDSGLESASVLAKSEAASEERVAALESELAQLKAMMASFALNQMGSPVSTDSSLAPTATSTPATSKQMPPPVPPCPPPPPPPVAPAVSPTFKPSVPSSNTNAKKPAAPANSNTAPDLSTVLKDVGKQKSLLRTVEKSPGGTPVRRTPKPCNPQDPTTILANALKQKFANTPTSLNESTDREASFNESPSPV